MKSDECNLMLNFCTELPLKRRKYILKKWTRRGWYKKGPIFDEFTDEFVRIQDLIRNKKKYIESWDGRVVIIHFQEDRWAQPETAGILEDHGDNGWHLFTRGSCRTGYSYYLDYHDFDDIAYVELHPNPKRIWTRMNYLWWKRDNRYTDRFHKKITEMSLGTIWDYTAWKVTGEHIYYNPAGKIGECFPHCQCKFIDWSNKI